MRFFVMDVMFLVSWSSMTSLQDFFSLAGNLFGSPLILGGMLLLTFGLIAVKSKLDGVSTFYFLMFFLMGLAGWNNPNLGFTQQGISGDFTKVLVLLFLLVAGGIGLVWLKLSQKN